MGATVTTPWGKAEVVETLELPQSSGGKAFASVVQLLAGPGGEQLVRFAYTTDGVARRGPVTLRAEDVVRLRAGLHEHRGLARALGLRPRREEVTASAERARRDARR